MVIVIRQGNVVQGNGMQWKLRVEYVWSRGCSCRWRGHNLKLDLGLALMGGGSQGGLPASLLHLGENL